MDWILHSVLIWPVEALVGFFFKFLIQWTNSHVGVSVILLSVAVNLLILPIYLVADRWMREEKDVLARMAPRASRIRAVFFGDERHFLLRTLHRQNGYHPLLSLRSSLGLLIQIPFFLAAYNVLAHAESLRRSIWFIPDGLIPDHLIHWNGGYINLLPLVMTAINLLSTLLYARNLRLQDSLQLFGLSAVFLVLLYNSPAGLVFYWTINNLFSLLKNAVSRMKNPRRAAYLVALAAAFLLCVWIVKEIRPLTVGVMIEMVLILAAVAVAPRVWKMVLRLASAVEVREGEERRWFIASTLVLYALGGLAVPLFFASASAGDGGIEPVMLVRTALQMFSLCVLLPWGLRALAPPPMRRLLTWFVGLAALTALINALILAPTPSFNESFTLNDPAGLRDAWYWLTSLAAVGVAAAVIALAVWLRRESWLRLTFWLGTCSLVAVAVWTLVTFPPPPKQEAEETQSSNVVPVFHLSQTQNNQFLVFIDGLPAASFPEMLASVPGLRESLDGFTWYANTVSYSPHTLHTTPSMMGGPNYTPEVINARTGVSLEKKHNEGLAAMPKVMAAQGERVVLSDPWYIAFKPDKSNPPFENLPGVTALNLDGHYSSMYFRNHPLPGGNGDLGFNDDVLSRFSIFRLAPPAIRADLYDDGSWWILTADTHLPSFVSGGYPNLLFLPQLCQVDNGPGGGNFFFSEVYHNNGAFGPDGALHGGSVDVPAEDLERYGDVYSARNIYDAHAVLIPVTAWLKWLKTQGVYDKTRIMIVADHGHPLNEKRFGTHPWYRPMILFKDYDRRGPLETNESLKTNADVPSFLTAGMKGAIPPRDPADKPVIHDGPWSLSDLKPEAFVFTQTMSLLRPDSRRAENWVQGKP